MGPDFNNNAIGMSGKADNFVVYNSRNGGKYGVTVGNLSDLSEMQCSVRVPNCALLAGIGLPDSPSFFPPYNSLQSCTDDGYQAAWRAMSKKQPKLNYFQRLYMLEKALTGNAPIPEEIRRIIKGKGEDFIPFPHRGVYIYPKFPHKIYPNRYDNIIRRTGRERLRGQMEPNKTRLHAEFLYQPPEDLKDDNAFLRIISKGANERNLPLIVCGDKNFTPEQLKNRRRDILTDEAGNAYLKSIEDGNFELLVMPYSQFGDAENQKQMVDSLLSKTFAQSDDAEAVIAIPYLPIPKDQKNLRYFWMQHSLVDMGMPFDRYADVKNYVIDVTSQDRVESEDLNRIHFTFIEMSLEGELRDPKLSFSYLPPNFRPHGPYAAELLAYTKLLSVGHKGRKSQKNKPGSRNPPFNIKDAIADTLKNMDSVSKIAKTNFLF